MNNQTMMVAGGACVLSLAAGAAAGYFFASHKLGKEFDERLAREIESTKAHYSLMLQQAKEKPASPLDIVIEQDEAAVEEPSDEEILASEALAKAGKNALRDYQGISTRGALVADEKPEITQLVRTNIFHPETSAKPQRPPRDEASAIPVDSGVTQTDEDGPYMILTADYLTNPFDYDQQILRYFGNDDVLIDAASNEVIENDRVGQTNLDDWKREKPGAGELLHIRHEALGTDYEIHFLTEPYSAYIGLDDPPDYLHED